jgi:trypsin-like peptidase
MPRGVPVAAAAYLGLWGMLGLGGLGPAACGDSHPPTAEVCKELQTSRSVLPSQCGPTTEFTPINSYQGKIASVQDREDAVVLINGSCTGTLIAASAGAVVLTAGHCVGLGDTELLAFNYEDQPDGDPLVTNGMAIEVSTEPDYALIQLEKLPAVTPTPLTTRPTDMLAIIQHPRGRPKVIAEGTLAGACNDLVYYSDLDTLVGSSGAGVLTDRGFLLAVHTDGDCALDGSGTNRGWSAASIVAASAYLQDIDIADR